MRKLSYLIVGILLGAGLTVSVSAAAEEVQNLIGKRVDGQAVVQVNGVGLSTQAVIIEGTSYAPIRAIGEAVGLSVDWRDNKVTLSAPSKEDIKAAADKTLAEIQLNVSKREKRTELQKQVDVLVAENGTLGETISKYESNFPATRTVTDEEYAAAKAKYEANAAALKLLYEQIDAIYK